MNTSRCWYKLGLENFSMRSSFMYPNKPNTANAWWSYDPQEVITDESLAELERRSFKPNKVMLFYKNALFSHTYAHCDMIGDTGLANPYAVNWVVGGKDSVMRWYEYPKVPADVSEYKGLLGSSYIQWPIKDLKLVDEACIQEPAIVRVNLPHSIHCGSEERWCFSLRLDKADVLVSWQEACVRHF